MSDLPEWARDMIPKVTHGAWEPDPTIEPTRRMVATDVRGGFHPYVAEYQEIIEPVLRRAHIETWTRAGHFGLDSDWEDGAFTDTITFRKVWNDRETWGRRTWERRDCGG